LAAAVGVVREGGGGAGGSARGGGYIPDWQLPPLIVWSVLTGALGLLYFLMAQWDLSFPRKLLQYPDMLLTFTIQRSVKDQAPRRRWSPSARSSALGGACVTLALITIFSLALSLCIRLEKENTVKVESLVPWRSSTWGRLGGLPWKVSPIPQYLPSGLAIRVTAFGESGACSTPLAWTYTAAGLSESTAASSRFNSLLALPTTTNESSVGPYTTPLGIAGQDSKWRLSLATGSSSSTEASPSPHNTSSFTFQCAQCAMEPNEDLTFLLPYSCQSILLEAVSTAGDGTLEYVAAPVPQGPPDFLLSSLVWPITPFLSLQNDTRQGASISFIPPRAHLGWVVVGSDVEPQFSEKNRENDGLAILPRASTVTVTVRLTLQRSIITTSLSDRVTIMDTVSQILSLVSLLGGFFILYASCHGALKYFGRGVEEEMGEKEEEEEEGGVSNSHRPSPKVVHPLEHASAKGSARLLSREGGGELGRGEDWGGPNSQSKQHRIAQGGVAGLVGAAFASLLGRPKPNPLSSLGSQSVLVEGGFSESKAVIMYNPLGRGKNSPVLSLPPPNKPLRPSHGHQSEEGSQSTQEQQEPLHPPPPSSQSEDLAFIFRPGREGGDEKLFLDVDQSSPLLPGWWPYFDAASGTTRYTNGEHVLFLPPLVDLPTGYDPYEEFVCQGGLRFFWDHPKGHPQRRLMTPPWRRVDFSDGEPFYAHKNGTTAWRPDYVY